MSTLRSLVLLVTASVVSAVLVTSTFAQTPRVERFGNTDYTLELVDAGDDFYAKTEGGLVKYEKYTRKSTVYTNLVGLDDNDISSMAVDNQLRLWLGTDEGLVRFDGEVREKHSILLADGRVPHALVAVSHDGNGGFWVAAQQWSAVISISHFDGANWTHFDSSKGLTDGWFGDLVVVSPNEVWFTGRTHKPYGHTGVGHIVNGKLTMYSSNDGLPTSEGYAITRDSSGRIWVGSGYSQDSRLSFFENGSWKKVLPSALPQPSAIYSMLTAPNGDVWVCAYDGAARFSSGQWTTFRTNEIGGGARSLALGRQGDIWVATAQGASVFENNAWRLMTSSDVLASNGVTTIVTDSRGDVLVGSDRAIDRPTAETWVRYQVPNEPKRTTVDVAVDKFGNAWTRANALDTLRGASRWDGQNWEHIELDVMGIPNDTIQDLTRHIDGTMWFGATGGIVHFDGTTWKSFTIEDSLRTWRQFSQIAADSSGNIWAITRSLVPYMVQGGVTYANEYSEIHKFDGTNWRTFRESPDVYIPVSVGGLEVDKKGIVWYYSDVHGDPGRSVCRFDGVSSTVIQIPDATGRLRPANLPSDMAIDNDDNIWFSIPVMVENSTIFDGQISRYDGQNWKHYIDAHGFPSIDEFIRPTSLAILPNNEIWIGTGDVGIVRLRDEQFETFSINDGLISNSISSASSGPDGTIWTVTYGFNMFQGVMKLSGLTASVKPYVSATGTALASPNPFVDRTTVSLSFEDGGMLSVALVDQLGRTVKEIFNGNYREGTTLDIPVVREGLASGVYYARAILESGESTIVKIVLQ